MVRSSERAETAKDRRTPLNVGEKLLQKHGLSCQERVAAQQPVQNPGGEQVAAQSGGTYRGPATVRVLSRYLISPDQQ